MSSLSFTLTTNAPDITLILYFCCLLLLLKGGGRMIDFTLRRSHRCSERF